MDPITILLILGAAAKIGSGVVSRANEREETRKQAEYEKEKAELEKKKAEQNKQAALDQMAGELQVQKEEDYAQATALQRGASNTFTKNMQSTYLSQITAESEHMDLMEKGNSALGDLQESEGLSGARGDSTVEGILKSSVSRQISENRAKIDKSLDYATASGAMDIREAATQANQIRSKYDDRSSFMNLYNLKRQNIIDMGDTEAAEYDLQENYLQGIIGSTDYWNANNGWMWADLFGVLGGASDTATILSGLS